MYMHRLVYKTCARVRMVTMNDRSFCDSESGYVEEYPGRGCREIYTSMYDVNRVCMVFTNQEG